MAGKSGFRHPISAGRDPAAYASSADDPFTIERS
jgi:hypothetical protein